MYRLYTLRMRVKSFIQSAARVSCELQFLPRAVHTHARRELLAERSYTRSRQGRKSAAKISEQLVRIAVTFGLMTAEPRARMCDMSIIRYTRDACVCVCVLTGTNEENFSNVDLWEGKRN